MLASASAYAVMRFFDMSDESEFEDADSITVITVIEKTTVTASAITRAKPRSSFWHRRNRLRIR